MREPGRKRKKEGGSEGEREREREGAKEKAKEREGVYGHCGFLRRNAPVVDGLQAS